MHLIKNEWGVGQEGKKGLRMNAMLWAETIVATQYMQEGHYLN